MSSDPIPSEPPNPPPIFPDDDLEDDVVSSDDPSSDSNDVVPDPDSSDDQDDTVSPPTTVTTTTTPIPPPIIPTPPPPSTTTAITAVIATAAPPERKPIDDSRRLFQRLWTDEDEIELLQGFLDYTTSRGSATASGHHHDTAAFYDQIKNKLQLEFNKNQLVEKLRRLKKKYRNVLSKMTSGKDFVFKSPHDHATFEISRKIWSNLSANYRAGGTGAGGGVVAVVEYDDEDHNPNRNAGYNPVTIAAATPPRPVNSSYVISHINLNAASPGGCGGSGSAGGYDMTSNAGLSKLSTRKRPRVTGGKVEEKMIKTEGCFVNNNVVNSSGNNNTNNNNNNNNNVGPNNYVNNVGVSPPLQGLVEETVRNCLSPVLKNLINNATNSAIVASPNNGGSRGFKGVGTLALNAVPLNFAGVTNVEGGMDEKWRKQQILELEVYSKRLELVQDQIKLSLEELRSTES